MKHLIVTLLLLAAFRPAIATAQSEPPKPITAKQLISMVVANQRTRGLSARGRMIINAPSAELRTLQILIKARHEGNSQQILYLALFPPTDKGRAVVIRKDGNAGITGFFREPDGKITSLSPDRIKQEIFGSDITIEDLVEEFWTWPSPRIVGSGEVSHRVCQIIESRPPKGHESSYSLVRAWINSETALPLRIESYGSDGKLVKRIECNRAVKSGDHWSIEDLTVAPSTPGHRTGVVFSKGSRDLEVPLSDFTSDGIARLLQD